MYQIHYFLFFSIFILYARSEPLTYYAIRDKWETALFGDLKDISSSCAFALDGLKKELKKPNINWALQMLDATTKLQSGILYGNIRDFGSFDQCLEIEGVIVNGDESKNIIGKHCLTKSPLVALLAGSGQLTKVDKILRDARNGNALVGVATELLWSVCVPDDCDASDLNKLFKELRLPFDDNNCMTKYDVPDFTVGDLLACIFFGLLLFIFIVSTTYDVYLHYTEKKSKHMLLTAFSALSNGKKLLTINNSPSQLKCLDGLRFLSMMWVVLGHSYAVLPLKLLFNLFKLNGWLHDIKSMYVIGATVSVDTFLVLSGLVMTYVFLMATQRGVKFNIIMYYVHRYLRLTPALLAIVVVHLTIIKFFGSGPQWPEVSKTLIVPCQEAWWVTLLYLHNYVKTTYQCVEVSWYLAVDMQLFVLSPLILFPLKKWPKYTIIGVFLLAIGSVLWGFILAYEGEWVALLVGQNDPKQTIVDMEMEYYVKTHMRAAPWLIGIVLGYITFKHKNGKRFEIHKMIALMLWIASIAVLGICVFGGHTLISTDSDDLRLQSASFVAFVRPAWAIALCWVIYACLFGYGGPINAFLSWSAFRIGSRFTYSIYLIHSTFFITSTASGTLPVNFSDYATIHKYLADFVIVFGIAIFWTLIFESPIMILEKVLFGKRTKAQPNVETAPEVKVTSS